MKRKIVLLFFVFLIYSCGNEYSTQNENLTSIKTNPYFSVVTPSGNEGLTESEQNKIMQGLPISKSFDIYNGIFVKNYFKDVIKPELLNKINITDKILLLNSYSQNGVVKLKDGSAELPVGDGVVDLNVNEYVSQKLTDKNILPSEEELYNTIVIIGEKIEISDNFYTNGKNIWIIANEVIFKDSGNGIAGKIITTPQKINIINCIYETTPGTEGYKLNPDGCDINGQKGLNGGDVFIGTNVLTGIPRIEANGLNGQNGTSALQAVFKGHSPEHTHHTEYLNEPTSLFYDYRDNFDDDINYYKSHASDYTGSEIILGIGGGECNYLVSNNISEFLHPDKKVSTAGGNGGNGGNGGDVYIFYNYLAPNLTLKSDGTLDNTFATSEINIISEKKCFDYSCSFEECAVIECNIDCATNNCSENECVQTKCDEIKKCKEAYVSICNGDKYTKGFENLLFNENTTGIEESTNGTCSDGIDNDQDGFIDCEDKECFYSPFITVCSIENSLEKCSDGIDNDNDGFIDCNDPNCKNNPYVLKCEYHNFLKESTNTTCSDGENNDDDGLNIPPYFSFPYRDCDDFGCQNNPLVTYCKCPNTTTWAEYNNYDMSSFILKECENNMNQFVQVDFENSIEECTDGVDNDEDGKVDCNDPHCSLNYFFGKRLCSNKIQTGNIKSIDNKIQNYFDIQNNGGKGGLRGYSSKPLLLKIYETLREICLPGDVNPVCIWITDKSVYEVCLPKINETNNGVNGEKGTTSFQKWNIKDLHKVMLGVSPQRFSVLNMFGDTSYKKADKKAASFYYSYVIKNLATIFSDLAITDMCSNKSNYTIQQYQICSLYKNAKLNFTKNAANINYYKTLELQSINPTIKLTGESGIITKFFHYTNELDKITNFINLYNATSGINQVLSNQSTTIEDNVILNNKDIEISQTKIGLLESERQEIQNILQNVQIQINRNRDRITVLDETIQDYYAPPTFGEFIEDLTVSLLKDIASSYASELVSSFSDNIKKHLKNYDLPTELQNQLQNLADKHLNVLECSNAYDSYDFCTEYNDLATKIQDVTDKAKSEVDDLLLKSLISTITSTDNDAFDEMKDYLKDSGKQIGKDFWDVMNGEYESESYSRSIIVDELERSILDTAQKQLALNYMENLYKLSQVDNEIAIEQKEIEKYELNKMLMYKQQQDISFVKNFCKSSNGEGEIDCLEGYERSYLYKNALSYASYLLDKLPKDYLEIVKHFEYENLPFNVTNGTNILKDFIQIEQNITLANYNAISITVAELQSTVSQSLTQKLHGSFYYRFYPQNLKSPTVEYTKLFNSITNQNLYQNEYLYIPIKITNEMLKRIQGLNNKSMYQIEDIQIGVNGVSSVYVCGLNATIIKADDIDSFYLDDTIENGRVKKQIIQFPLTNKVKINDSFELKTIIKHQEIETNCVNTHNCNTNQTSCITNLQTKTIDNIVNVVSDRFINRSIVGTWYIIIPKYNSNIDINPSIESFDIKFFVKGVQSSLDINGYCGNQLVENSEQCEGNQTIDCMDLSNNYTPGNSAKCNPWTCSWDTSECTVTSCNRIKDENGNYIENPYKECDEISETTTCSSLNSDYATGITICNPKTCRFDRNICPQELIIEDNSTQIYIFPNIFKYLNQLRNNKYRTEQTAKNYMHSLVYTSDYRQSFYCGCSYDETKTVNINNCGYTPVSSYQTYATKIEWEHSLPASLMGQTFDEYVNHENYKECNGSLKPDGTYYPVLSGRECAQSLNVEYKFMTADMYNLYPAIGQLNRLRSDKMYSEIEGENSPFGSCDFEYNSTNAEPRDEIKGDIARNYFYMYAAYPGRILLTASQWAMFLKWNHEDPISYEECSRARRVQAIQQNVNKILDEACSTIFGL